MRGAIAVMAVVVLSAGCAESKPPTESPTATVADTSAAVPVQQAVPFGATQTVSSEGATARYTVANLRQVPPDAQIIPAKGTMYAVDVTIAAQTGTTTYNGFYFVAKAADGSTIAPAVGAVRPGITSGQLPAGQQTDGHVAYDVPNGKTVTAILLRDPHGKLLAVWAQ
ncbi:DUF1942 domain-containing protein [Mycobacterium sp. NBC_00419]|uniref:DUF1942 domain-containing protein n=1 Tax=Mycobacterium sp. NBC_00419 TaxID=2975989 RepID=UPI002E1BD714